MRVNTKILLLSAISIILATLWLAGMWYKQLDSIKAVEKARIAELKVTFNEIITLKSSSPKSYLYDNTYWDEMVNFVSTHDAEWAQINIVEAMNIQKIDYTLIFDNQNNIVFYEQKSDSLPLIKDKIPYATLNAQTPQFLNYFLLVDDTIIEIFLAPIQPSNDLKRETTPKGYCVVGKIWTQEYIADFEKITKQTVAIATDNSHEKYDFFIPLLTHEGIPAGHLGVELKSTILDIINDIFTHHFHMMILASSLIFIFMGIIVYYLIVKPLKTISHIIQTRDISDLPKCLQRQDEFGDIAKSIHELFEALELESSIFDNSGFLLIRTDKEGLIQQLNKEAEKILGYKNEELVNKYTPEIFHLKAEMKRRAKEFSEALKVNLMPSFEVLVAESTQGLQNEHEWTYITKKGKRIPVHLCVTALRDSEGHIYGYLGIARDIREKAKNNVLEKLTNELKEKNDKLNRYISLVDHNIIVFSTNVKGIITYVSDAFVKISAYSEDELVGKSHKIISREAVSLEMYKQMCKNLRANIVWQGEVENRDKNGNFYWVNTTISPIFDKDSKKIGYTAICQDISDKKLIEKLSITDGLTNIYNRRHFDDIFPKVINSAKRKDELVCFLFLDIDNFKNYNDHYGHQKGDEVLMACASVLKNALKRADDYCFRLGGEEFGIAFKVENHTSAIEFANKVREDIEALKIPHEYSFVGPFVTISAGLVCQRATEIDDVEKIYKKADDLLYKAKENGKNKVAV